MVGFDVIDVTKRPFGVKIKQDGVVVSISLLVKGNKLQLRATV
jgi:hypothetical protein